MSHYPCSRHHLVGKSFLIVCFNYCCTHMRQGERGNKVSKAHTNSILFDYASLRKFSVTVLCFSSMFNTFRFARVGSIVLAIHDASDVLLEIGKMSKYSGAETMASIAFILFVFSWVILRLIYYPFWILWSTRFVTVHFPVYIIFASALSGPHLLCGILSR